MTHTLHVLIDVHGIVAGLDVGSAREAVVVQACGDLRGLAGFAVRVEDTNLDCRERGRFHVAQCIAIDLVTEWCRSGVVVLRVVGRWCVGRLGRGDVGIGERFIDTGRRRERVRNAPDDGRSSARNVIIDFGFVPCIAFGERVALRIWWRCFSGVLRPEGTFGRIVPCCVGGVDDVLVERFGSVLGVAHHRRSLTNSGRRR